MELSATYISYKYDNNIIQIIKLESDISLSKKIGNLTIDDEIKHFQFFNETYLFVLTSKNEVQVFLIKDVD